MKKMGFGLIFILNLGRVTAQLRPAPLPVSYTYHSVSLTAPLNAAALAFAPAAAVLDSGCAGFAGHKLVFAGTGLAETSLGWVLGKKQWRFTGSAFSFGMEEMKYSMVKLGLARMLANGLSMGAVWGMGQWRVQEEGQAAHPFYQLGICWQFGSKWIFQGDMENPWLPVAANGPPLVFRTAAECRVSADLGFRAGIVFEENKFPVWLGSICYRLGNDAWFRTCWISGSGIIRTAFGLRFGAWGVETGTEYHFRLGFSPGLMLQFKPLQP